MAHLNGGPQPSYTTPRDVNLDENRSSCVVDDAYSCWKLLRLLGWALEHDSNLLDPRRDEGEGLSLSGAVERQGCQHIPILVL